MSGSPHQVEIQLGHLCNNRCVFCVSGQVSEWRQAPQIAAAPVIEKMRTARAGGAHKITLLGGEPSIQRSFLEVVAAAVELGFDEIVIFTNGVMSHRREYLEKVIALGGNFTWRFSIQGGNEAAHDAVTKRAGSFAKIIAGVSHLHEMGARITTNLCVNELSYRSLPDYPELCKTHGITQLHVDQVRPRDAGERDDDYLRSIMARYSDMAPYFARMLEGFDRELGVDYDVNVGNLPYCVLPDWAHKIHHDGELTFTVAVDGAQTLSEPWDKYADKRSDKFKPPQCAECVFNASCNGVFQKYAQFYGVDEFRPVKVEQLRGDHFFCHAVEPDVRRWLEATPPAPWRHAHVMRDTRARLVVARFSAGDGSGREVAIELRPLSADGVVFDATNDRFGVRVAGRGDAALVDWALEVLGATRDPLVSIAQGAQRRGEIAGLRFIGARRTGEDAVALYFRGDGERVVAAMVRPGPSVRVVNAVDADAAAELERSLLAL